MCFLCLPGQALTHSYNAGCDEGGGGTYTRFIYTYIPLYFHQRWLLTNKHNMLAKVLSPFSGLERRLRVFSDVCFLFSISFYLHFVNSSCRAFSFLDNEELIGGGLLRKLLWFTLPPSPSECLPFLFSSLKSVTLSVKNSPFAYRALVIDFLSEWKWKFQKRKNCTTSNVHIKFLLRMNASSCFCSWSLLRLINFAWAE